MTDEPPAPSRAFLHDDDLPFLRGPLPASFRRRRITLAAGRSRAYDAAEWRDALVVVQCGRLHLECHDGGFRLLDEGAVACLDGLALRALHNRGPSPTVLVAVSRLVTGPRPRASPGEP